MVHRDEQERRGPAEDRRTRQIKFQVNEGPIDRLVRIVLGVGLFAVAAAGLVTAPLIYVVLALAGWVVVTGVTGFCLLYVPFGISTRRADAADAAGR